MHLIYLINSTTTNENLVNTARQRFSRNKSLSLSDEVTSLFKMSDRIVEVFRREVRSCIDDIKQFQIEDLLSSIIFTL